MKILYVCNDLSYFDAHRRALADAARRRGFNVLIACGNAAHGGKDRVDFVLDIPRHQFDIVHDLRLAREIARLAKQEKADLVHLITIKPVLIGAIGLRLLSPSTRVVATFPGLGRIFDLTDGRLLARLRRGLVTWGLRFGLRNRNATAIFETESDRQRLIDLGILDDHQAIHIPGAGVDPTVYARRELPPGKLRLLFAARLLRKKGISAFAEAADLVAKSGHDISFVVAGTQELNDPDGLSATEIATIKYNQNIDYLGQVHSGKMPELLASVHALVLPTSYQEGVPRILIEGGAVGRPAIVSNNPGCLAFVEDGQNGIVLRTIDAQAIADAAVHLSVNPNELLRMSEGATNRFITGSFSINEVVTRTLALYSQP